MTKKKFIDYIIPYGNHVRHQFGNYFIEKRWHLTNEDDAFNYRKSVKCSDGSRHDFGFRINGLDSTIDECVLLITNHERRTISN